MDPLTHALASYSLKRAALPRAPRSITLSIVIAGTIADLDILISYSSPSTYLTFYRTYLHSLPAAIVFALLATLPFLRPTTSANPFSRITIFVAAFAAAAFHLVLDLCQSSGVQLLWPFSSRRFALDWLPHLDLWILGIFLAGILLPMLSGLVTEEIGARSKSPRGRVGAALSIVAVILYIVLRSVLHGDAIAALQSRTYRGELPRRVAAFGAASSPFIWHGIVETERALVDVEVPVGPAGEFDPGSALITYKPEPSPALNAARNSAVARRFLQVARFPKATVEPTPSGYHVILRDFPFTRDSSARLPVQALIDTDPSGRTTSEELVWLLASRTFWWH